MIPAEAVNTHWLNTRDGSWCCDGCDWTGDTIEAFWAAHNDRTHDDNIPF